MHPSRPGNYRCCFSSRFPRLTYLSKSSLVPCIPSLGWRGVALCHCTGGTAAEPLEPHLHMPLRLSPWALISSLQQASSRLYHLRGVHHVYLPLNLYLRSTSFLTLISSHLIVLATPYAEPIPTRLPLLFPHSPAWSLCYHACLPFAQLNLHTYSGHVYSPAIHATQAA